MRKPENSASVRWNSSSPEKISRYPWFFVASLIKDAAALLIPPVLAEVGVEATFGAEKGNRMERSDEGTKVAAGAAAGVQSDKEREVFLQWNNKGQYIPMAFEEEALSVIVLVRAQ